MQYIETTAFGSEKIVKSLYDYGFAYDGKLHIFDCQFILENKTAYERLPEEAIVIMRDFCSKNKLIIEKLKTYYNLYAYLRKKGYCSRYHRGKLYIMRKGKHADEEAYLYMAKELKAHKNLASAIKDLARCLALRKELLYFKKIRSGFLFYSFKAVLID